MVTTKTTRTVKKKTPTIDINLDNLMKYHGYWTESHEWLKNFINQHSDEIKVGAEIGVAFGSNVNTLMEGTELEKLFAIDSYKEDTWDLGGYVNIESDFESFDGLYEHVNQFLSQHGTRVKLIRMTSEQASKKIKNESLDFVFIDADHNDLENDIKYWESKVRDGGYIMGHDWMHPSFGNITDFLLKYYGEERVVGIEGPVHIWYVKKEAFM